MFQKWLSLLLTVMIVLQSVSAVADVHQFHQTDSQHHEFEHEHPVKPDTQELYVENSEVSSSTLEHDCHHCCHCHSTSNIYLVFGKDALTLSAVSQQLPDYSSSPVFFSLKPSLRPPIA